MENAIVRILDTWRAFLEHDDYDETDQVISHAEKVLASAPPIVKDAFIELAGNWGRDDMVLMDSVIDYIEVLVRKVSEEEQHLMEGRRD